jgi:hypothetical protein
VTVRIPPVFVDETSSLRHEVLVKNDTGRPVRFTGVRQSCACAGATKLAALELEPEQETTLQFDIDLRQRKGPQHFVCYLVEANGNEWTYTLETTLYARAHFADTGMIHFGMVDPKADEVRETQFYLHAENQQALPESVSFRTDSDFLRVEVGPGIDEEQPDGTAGRRFLVRLRLRSPDAPGLSQAGVVADVERQGKKQQLQSGVTWNVRTLCSVVPSQAYFGTVDPSSPTLVERRVLIRRADGQPVAIKKIEAPCSAVRCSVEKTPDASTGRLLLVLDPKAMDGPLWGEVTVEIDHPVQRVVRIPVAALPRRSE